MPQCKVMKRLARLLALDRSLPRPQQEGPEHIHRFPGASAKSPIVINLVSVPWRKGSTQTFQGLLDRV